MKIAPLAYTSGMHEAPRSVLSPIRLQAAGATDIGRSRQHNEDAVLIRPDLALYLVADGAGGHNAGNVASAIGTTSVAHYFESTQTESRGAPALDELGLASGARRLSRAIQAANREIIELAKTRNNYHGMGSTVVAAYFQPELGLLHLGHVGDSRAYRLRDARLEQLTTDHSLIHDILELRPDIDDAVAAKLPRNVVTRALGMEPALRIAVATHAFASSDRYLLCSDGLTHALEDREIADVMRVAKGADEAVKLLIDMALEAGADDNIAAVVVQLDLAPGVSQFPRRSATPAGMPMVRPKRRPPLTPAEASSPEIVIVGVEMLEDDSSAQFHVVPAESSSPNLLSVLGTFVGPLRPKPPKIPSPKIHCPKCNATMSEAVLLCSACGTPRDLGKR